MKLRRELGAALVLLAVAVATVWTGLGNSLEDSIEKFKVEMLCQCPCPHPLGQCGSECGTAPQMLADLRARLAQGQSEDRIYADYEALYGAGIYSLPSTEGASLLAWILPGVGLVVGAFLVWGAARRLRPSKEEEGKEGSPAAEDAEELKDSEEYREKLAKELREV